MPLRWDAARFAALYERHTPKLYGLALRLAGGVVADAEDLVHQCWLRAAEARRPFAGRARFSSWLCAILVNVYRESPRRKLLSSDAEPDAPTSAPSACKRLDVERLLAAMPAAWREAVVLHDLYGFTHEEIADRLGIAPGTSKSRLGRARAWFRQHYPSQRSDHETG